MSTAQAGLFFKIVRNAETEDKRQFDEEFELFRTLYIKHRKSKKIKQLENGDTEVTEDQNKEEEEEEEDDDDDDVEEEEEEVTEVETHDVEGGHNSSDKQKIFSLC